jgi:DNA invertase Pin-like site-specific DNA recombinase
LSISVEIPSNNRPNSHSFFQYPTTLKFDVKSGRTMIIGYARVSTDDQHLDLQQDALQKAGCERLFEDQASGVKANRTGLGQLLMSLRAGDTVVIWRLDRLGRSLKDLIAMIEQFDTAHVGLRSVQENIDTTSIGGRLVFHLFGALAEFERHLIRERTQAGLSAARARGRQGGRKKRLDPTKRAVALRLYHERNLACCQNQNWNITVNWSLRLNCVPPIKKADTCPRSVP